MGDWFQTIVDVEATAQEAEALADATVTWLVDARIIAAEASDCVLGGAGHAPGTGYLAAVSEADPYLLTSRTNGVEIITGQAVFYSMGAETVGCPHCRQAVALSDEHGHPNAAWHELSDSIDAWFSESGDGRRPCPTCRADVGLNDWAWSPPWGFGYLGLKFWNWPPLKPQFLTEVSRRLGHRTVHPFGKV